MMEDVKREKRESQSRKAVAAEVYYRSMLQRYTA
jgi:hypothetical protein